MQHIQLINPEFRKATLAILATILAATLIFASAPSALAAIHPIVQSVNCSASGNEASSGGDPPGQTPGATPGNGKNVFRAIIETVDFDLGDNPPDTITIDETDPALSGEGGNHCTNA